MRVAGAVIAAALSASLAACASDAVRIAPENLPTMAPEQSPAEACDLSLAAVDRIVEQVRQELETARTGGSPDFAAIADRLQGSVGEIADGISNSEVAGRLDQLQHQLTRFGDLAPPDSLLGMPGYLADLGGRLAEIQRTVGSLQTLCTRADGKR